jgi:hypothetical protein
MRNMRQLLIVLMLLARPLGLAASETPEIQGQDGPRWIFVSHSGADLWFHGMALVDPQGPGPNPLYDPAYPSKVRRAKESAGVYPTVLDREAGRFRDAFRRDPALEVLHFLPLYFVGAGRVEIFEALKLLATQPTGIPRSPGPRTATGLAAIGSVLQRPEQRVLLGEFLSVLEAEWDAFLGPDLRSKAASRNALLRLAQGFWDQHFQPALGPFLSGTDLPGGVVALSSALGSEGRVFSGTPQSWRDNVVAVQDPGGEEMAKNAIYLLIRELSFSLSRQASNKTGVEMDRFDEEALVAKGAIRGGALLLEQNLPEEAEGFKKFFLEQGGFSDQAGGVGQAFQDAYPLETAFLDALLDVIEATNNTGD